MYENIDMKKNGLLLKEMIEKTGYTVKRYTEHIASVLPATDLSVV